MKTPEVRLNTRKLFVVIEYPNELIEQEIASEHDFYAAFARIALTAPIGTDVALESAGKELLALTKMEDGAWNYWTPALEANLCAAS